jgi:riboflavin biosynthesis pyrimidine reductase
MSSPGPLDVLFDEACGTEIALPQQLREVYGQLRFPTREDRPWVVSNFVQSIDGVVTLDSGKTGGGPVSGGNEHDRIVMGILRSVADAVIVGAGTLRSVPKHLWTPEYVYPGFEGEFQALRSSLGKPPHPLNVIVTAAGELDPGFAVLSQEDISVLIVTTAAGAKKASKAAPNAKVIAVSNDDRVGPRAILGAVREVTQNGQTAGAQLFLTEAGPKLMSQFLEERLVDELFLTVAPQVAGREDSAKRPGLAAGREFAPDDPRWWNLVSARRAGDHLLLRYALAPVGGPR